LEQDWNQIWSELGDGMSNNPSRIIRHRAVEKLLRGSQIADFGAGDGELVIKLRKKGFHVKGFEMSQQGVDKANTRALAENLGKVLYKFNDVTEIPGTYSSIIVSEVIEHIEFPIPTLIELRKKLEKSGNLIVTVPAGPMSEFDKFIGHYRHYSKKTIEKLLTDSGFKVLETKQIGFPILNLVRIWSLIRGKKMVSDLKKSQSRKVNPIIDTMLKIILVPSQLSLPIGWQLVVHAVSSED
jgi:cyclopropane fatty-acyl-phospholipid synthase-like methyltransferase